MADLLSFCAHRVDAARKLMAIPARAAEGSGRLFLAKRCHEAVKRGEDLAAVLDAIEAEVTDGLGAGTHEGVRLEAEHIRRRLQSD